MILYENNRFWIFVNTYCMLFGSIVYYIVLAWSPKYLKNTLLNLIDD